MQNTGEWSVLLPKPSFIGHFSNSKRAGLRLATVVYGDTRETSYFILILLLALLDYTWLSGRRVWSFSCRHLLTHKFRFALLKLLQ